jgi:hypothetical protein
VAARSVSACGGSERATSSQRVQSCSSGGSRLVGSTSNARSAPAPAGGGSRSASTVSGSSTASAAFPAPPAGSALASRTADAERSTDRVCRQGLRPGGPPPRPWRRHGWMAAHRVRPGARRGCRCHAPCTMLTAAGRAAGSQRRRVPAPVPGRPRHAQPPAPSQPYHSTYLAPSPSPRTDERPSISARPCLALRPHTLDKAQEQWSDRDATSHDGTCAGAGVGAGIRVCLQPARLQGQGYCECVFVGQGGQHQR